MAAGKLSDKRNSRREYRTWDLTESTWKALAVTPVLLDAGAIVALLDRDEKYHRAVGEVIAAVDSPLITCEAVIAESCYLLRRIKGAPEAVLANIEAGIFQIPVPLTRIAAEVRRIMQKYRDRTTSLADACLICLAAELNTGDVLTLDADFRIYRWGRNKPFRMLVPLD